MIRLTVRDAGTERVLSVSTIAPVHVQVPSDCVRADGKCDDKDKKDDKSDDKAATSSNAPGAAQASNTGQGTTP
jgi:general secretion pathway protein J